MKKLGNTRTDVFNCAKSNKVFKTADQLKQHRRIVHGSSPTNERVKCSLCTKTFTSKNSLNQHIKKTHPGIKFSCQICNKTLTSKSILKHHIDTVHYGIMPYSCSYCNKTFTYNSSLQGHINVQHKIQKEEYKCVICSRIFLLQSHFYAHRRIHLSEKLHKCYFCPKTLYYSHAKNARMLAHTTF